MSDITASELKDRQAKGEDLNILDVREEWEFEEENMGAKLIPLNSLPTRLGEIEDWKGKEVIVHCRSGKRSAQAQKYMQAQGFSNVRNLEGGIMAWSEA